MKGNQFKCPFGLLFIRVTSLHVFRQKVLCVITSFPTPYPHLSVSILWVVSNYSISLI